jgi:hypothetical protein
MGARAMWRACWLLMLTGPAWAGGCLDLPQVAQVLAVDQRDRNSASYDDERELRDFGLYAYRSISADVINGQGVYLDALRERFGPACADDAAVLSWMRSMLLASSTVNDFARRLAVARHLLQLRPESSPENAMASP